MQIFIRTLTGKVYVITIDREDSLEKLKEALFDESGFPPELQRLIYRGKQMDDDSKTLADYGISNDAEFSLIVRPPNSNRDQESDSTGKPRPVDLFLPDRCQKHAKYCGYCGAADDHHHSTLRACTRAPMTLAVSFLGHFGPGSSYAFSLTLPLTSLVSEMKNRLVDEIKAARMRDVIDPYDYERHFPCPFHSKLPEICAHHIVLMAHGMVMSDDNALCDYGFTEGCNDVAMAFDLNPQPIFTNCTICGEVYNTQTQANNDCRRTIHFTCPIEGDELTPNDADEDAFDLMVGLANGEPGDSMELLLGNGELFRCEVPPKQYTGSVQNRRQIFRRRHQLDLEERARFRAVLTADEWAAIEARRETLSQNFERLSDEAEDKRARYMLARYLHCHVFGTRINNFDFELWAKSQYAHFYFWLNHRNDHGCSGPWSETILGRELGLDRPVRWEFVLPGNRLERHVNYFLWLYDASIPGAFIDEMGPYLNGDINSSEVRCVFLLGLNFARVPLCSSDEVEGLALRLSKSFLRNGVEAYTDHRLQTVVKCRYDLHKGSQMVGFLPPHVSMFHVPNIQSTTALSFVIDSIARCMEPIESLERTWKRDNSKVVYDFESYTSFYNLATELTKEQAIRKLTDTYQLYFGFWHEKVQPLIDSAPWFDVWPHDDDGISETRCGSESFGSLPLEVGAIILYYYMVMNSLAPLDWKRLV